MSVCHARIWLVTTWVVMSQYGRGYDSRTNGGDVASHPKYMNFNNTSFEACYFLQWKIYGWIHENAESLTSRELDFPQNIINDICSGRSKGNEGPLCPFSFIFMQFSAKIMANNRLVPLARFAPPALENPGSTTDSPPLLVPPLLVCFPRRFDMYISRCTQQAIHESSLTPPQLHHLHCWRKITIKHVPNGHTHSLMTSVYVLHASAREILINQACVISKSDAAFTPGCSTFHSSIIL